MEYPAWFYYPSRDRAPPWVYGFVEVVAMARGDVESKATKNLTSDRVLSYLRPGLVALGFEVEAGKAKADRIRRPVLFGDEGAARVSYEVDAVHDELGVLVEVEAGRGARGNAVYRDLVRSSLIVGARYLALGVMQEYRHLSGGKPVPSRVIGTPGISLMPSLRVGSSGCPSRASCCSDTENSTCFRGTPDPAVWGRLTREIIPFLWAPSQRRFHLEGSPRLAYRWYQPGWSGAATRPRGSGVDRDEIPPGRALGKGPALLPRRSGVNRVHRPRVLWPRARRPAGRRAGPAIHGGKHPHRDFSACGVGPRMWTTAPARSVSFHRASHATNTAPSA